jgi:hypothetical protein
MTENFPGAFGVLGVLRFRVPRAATSNPDFQENHYRGDVRTSTVTGRFCLENICVFLLGAGSI